MAIDIGYGAVNGDTNSGATYTNIDIHNPANGTGTLRSFEVWMLSDATGVLIGTFYGSGTSYSYRDHDSIGNVTSGSKQTFTGKSVDVQTWDFLGCYCATGQFETTQGAGSGQYYITGNYFSSGTQTYTERSSGAPYAISIYATDSGEPAGWTTAKLGGIASASIIKVGGIAVASVKKVMGVSVQV